MKKGLDIIIAVGKPKMKKEESMNEEMSDYNKVEFGEGTFPNSESGAEVKFTGMGRIVEKPDGSKCVEVTSLNGVPVTGGEMEEEMSEQSEESEEGETSDETAPDYSKRGDEALDEYMKTQRNEE